MADRDGADVETAEQLEREARRLLDDTADTSLASALDQLHADRTNGEALDTAIRQVRDAIAQLTGPRRGGSPR